VVSLTIQQAADVWTRNGGNPAHTALMVAVAEAESTLITDSVSPTQDYGLWQINIGNLANLGLNTTTALDPDRNAQAAIQLSQNGSNIRDWATAYNPPPPPWLPVLTAPQPGSPVANWLPIVQNALAQVVAPTPAPPTIAGCGPHDIGIPNSAVAGMAVGESRQVTTCPGGSFDAGDLQDWYSFSFWLNGNWVTYTNGWRGYYIPAATTGTITRTGPPVTPPPPGFIGGPVGPPATAPSPPPSPAPPPSTPIFPVPPITGRPPTTPIFPVPPITGGPVIGGRAGAESAWQQVRNWANQGNPEVIQSLTARSQRLRGMF
jgi:hypothetical protein